jgi:hypothetical protein
MKYHDMRGPVGPVRPLVLDGPVLQSTDPLAVLDVSPLVRAVASFLVVLLVGGVIIFQYGGRLDAAVDATSDRPVSSVLYGVVAIGVAVFLVGYAFSQLTTLGATTLVFTLSVVVLGGILSALGGFGFVVVGLWVTRLLDAGDPWVGVVTAGTVGALAWFLLPALVALVVWFGIAAVGIGGPARVWMHADRAEREMN